MNPQFEAIGKQFADHYYKTFDSNRSALGPLYGTNSMMSFENDQYQGSDAIVKKLASLPFSTVQHQVVTVDCQPTTGNGIIVLVAGPLVVDNGSNPLKYAQCFHLAPCATGYFVLNDIFRLNIG